MFIKRDEKFILSAVEGSPSIDFLELKKCSDEKRLHNEVV
jgi:hypothetical protein